MDDVLIFSKDEEIHLRHLEIVLKRLQEHELYVSPKKCEFVREEIAISAGSHDNADGCQEIFGIVKSFPKVHSEVL